MVILSNTFKKEKKKKKKKKRSPVPQLELFMFN